MKSECELDINNTDDTTEIEDNVFWFDVTYWISEYHIMSLILFHLPFVHVWYGPDHKAQTQKFVPS